MLVTIAPDADFQAGQQSASLSPFGRPVVGATAFCETRRSIFTDVLAKPCLIVKALLSHDQMFLRGLGVLELGGDSVRDKNRKVYVGSYAQYVRAKKTQSSRNSLIVRVKEFA